MILATYLKSAVGTDFSVVLGGSCRNYFYNIEWLQDPGKKELVVVDDSNLDFDG